MNNNFIKRLSFKEILLLLVLLISGVIYVWLIWKDVINQERQKALNVALTVEAALPKTELDSLPDNPGDLHNRNFDRLKKMLQQVIAVNPRARFAYLYLERNGKLYFIVDSEPESSPDFSPSGQEFTEADPIDKKPITEGRALVTNQVTDRWGTWISAEVPVKNPKTGEVIAAFGMDYNAKSWQNRILFEVSESSLLVLIILVLILILMHDRQKNERLKSEIMLRKLAEEGLKKSESDYRLLFELNPQTMLVFDLETMKILAVNQAALEKYGYSEAEFLKMKITSLNSSDQSIKLSKNGNENRHLLLQPEIWNHHLKNGSTIQVEVHSHNFDFRHKNARLVLLIDITERLKTEKILYENELRLSNLVDNLPGFVYRCALDENYSMDFISDGCTLITGYSPDQFITQKSISFNELILPEYRKPIREKWQSVITERHVFEEEYPVKTSSGEIKWLWERGRGIFDENGELRHLEGYIDDVTEKKRNEAELISAKEKAQKSDRLKSAFLANISHEIRTPMNSILGFADLLKSPDLTPENQQKFIEIIEESGQRMLNVISDLMDISKIDAGEIILKTSETNLNQMMLDLSHIFIPLNRNKNLQFSFTAGLPDDDCTVITDSGKLHRILSNLIKNAFKFTERGQIEYGYALSGNNISFFVKDTGIGIPEDQREDIFKRFRQGNPAQHKNFEGAGLGLTISKAYIELLGGKIWIDSELNKGTTVWFEIPYQPAHSSSKL